VSATEKVGAALGCVFAVMWLAWTGLVVWGLVELILWLARS
jgi:hypothetical protein